MNIQTTMSGLRKAAIVALMIGEDASASIFKHLSEDEIETLLSEMAALGRVSSKMGEQVLEEFHQTAVAAEHVARGDIEFAKRVLVKSFGPDTARRMIDRVMRAFQSNAGFASLERADPQQLSKFILGEHPQTIALILAHLQPANAALLVTLLPEELRVDVLARMASPEDISPEIASRVSSVIELRKAAAPTLTGASRAWPVVLLIEDDDAVRELIGPALRANGFDVIAAASGEEALDLAARCPVDLLLSDVMLPKQNGFEVARQIRRRSPHLPIVFMSAYYDQAVAEAAHRDITSTILQKPFAMADLVAHLRAVYEVQASNRSALQDTVLPLPPVLPATRAV